VQRRSLLDYAVYIIVRVLITVIAALHLDTCHVLARWLAVALAHVLKVRGSIVDENLKQAYPHWTSAERAIVAQRMWEHLLLMVAEVAQAQRKIHATNWHQYIYFREEAAMARWFLQERPMIVVSGHFGNFELSGYLLGLFGFPTYTVIRPLDNPLLDRFVHRFRAGTGQHLLSKSGSAAQVAELLARGRILAVLGDQHAGRSGCWVDFFGRPASTHKAIALFSLSSGAPLLVSYSRRTGKSLCYECGIQAVADPLDAKIQQMTISQLTQWFTHQLEVIIHSAPEQYWWLHRRWKGEPHRRRRRRKSAPKAQAA
jgi:KDO2-lipid IV(A) lauroyltransferase